jgi:uncharacterized protein (DUF1015 family)
MAQIFPFQPYRYTSKAGPLDKLATQPYDKISPALQAEYLAASPYNFVRIILGERFAGDDDGNNVYTRAARSLEEWISGGILARDAEPSLYAYFQEFTDPDSGERATRKGFIGLGPVVDYSEKIVHRHEQTLSGPKKDRLELLRHTRSHFGQLFMLYPDPACRIDALLDEAAKQPPTAEVRDHYEVLHRVWRISDTKRIEEIRALMADKKLLIADGHHRYETALAYSKENTSPGAQRVMMTFVNMNSPGLKILATHRIVRNLEGFDPAALRCKLEALGRWTMFDSADGFKAAFSKTDPGKIRLGLACAGEAAIGLLEAERGAGGLDVRFLHERVLGESLGISEEAVRDEKHLTYVRGVDAALGEVREGKAQAAFLLQPTTVEQVADVSFSGGVMPQKSTDFYPKLLSGLTIYAVEG